MMENLTGKQFGPYQIVAPLGEGGMAAVYKAYQPGMERYVALKVLPRNYADDAQFVARFQREAKLLAQLQHPHILPVFDFGQAEGYTYIVMPFIQSGTLTGQLKGTPLPLPRIRQIITQVGEALNYAHARGMIHRDIKPSNILIDESGNCLLTDFGLARMVEDAVNLTSTGTIMGTPAYMSPEQGSGSKIDARSDIYSLGVVLFEMATGRVPYQAETPIAVVFKHVQDPLPPARSINPDLPEAVELVILKSLAKNPEDRYQTAGDMVRAVQAAIPESHISTIVQKPAVEPAPVEENLPAATVVQKAEAELPAPEEMKPEMPPTMIAEKKKRSGMPAWIWAVIGVVLLLAIAGGGYFAFGRKSAPAAAPTAAIAAAKPTAVPTGATAKATKVAPAVMVNLPGSYQDRAGCAAQWDPACPATFMTRGDDGKYTLTVQLPAGNYEFKIAEGGNWTVNYGSDGKLDGPNFRLKVTPDSAVTFVYDPATHMVTTSSKAAVIATAAPPNVLIATGVLPAGGQILSQNKLYRFEVQPAGALVLYDSYTNKQLWSSQTKGDPDALVIQDDGNLVLYAKNGSVIWASDETGKKGDYFLTLQDDGNLVVYRGIYGSPNITPIWATNTAR
jgi:tRNA A-37 threonylcarbamoyl transferase component Bud32/outer membrane biosynthesis protein TonB